MHPTNLYQNLWRVALDAELDKNIISRYLKLDGKEKPRGNIKTIAINPVNNTERIVTQRGVFTLHGSKSFILNNEQASSLFAVAILREHKENLITQLKTIGVDEMSLFQEPEYISRQLIKDANLIS